MHTKVMTAHSIVALERVLEALAPELIESTDEELLQAAKDLGMNATTRGSAAFSGLKYFATPRVSEFFDLPSLRQLQVETEQNTSALPPSSKHRIRRKKRSEPQDGGGSSVGA